MKIKINKITLVLAGVILLVIFAGIYRTPAKPRATINGHTFALEVAQSEKEKELGLSNRDSLPQDRGMLFVFEQPSYATFWMKDMRFPIDIIFINQDRIVSIIENAPIPASKRAGLPLYRPENPSDKALEINAGLSKKYNFKKGDKVKIEF